MKSWRLLVLLLLAASAHAREQYDLLLKGGHVIDPRNKMNEIRDVAIRDRKIAAVAPGIDPATAYKTVDVKGLYVTPGTRRYPCAHFRQHRRAQFVCGRAQRVSR